MEDIPDDGDEERRGREILGDTFAGATRAFLRAGSLNAVKVKAKAAHRALESVSKATEWASLAQEATSSSNTVTGKVVKVARSYSTGFVLGTVLYGTYEEVELRSGSHGSGPPARSQHPAQQPARRHATAPHTLIASGSV